MFFLTPWKTERGMEKKGVRVRGYRRHYENDTVYLCSRDDRPQTMVITRNETPGSIVDEIGGGGQLTTFIHLHSLWDLKIR